MPAPRLSRLGHVRARATLPLAHASIHDGMNLNERRRHQACMKRIGRFSEQRGGVKNEDLAWWLARKWPAATKMRESERSLDAKAVIAR